MSLGCITLSVVSRTQFKASNSYGNISCMIIPLNIRSIMLDTSFQVKISILWSLSRIMDFHGLKSVFVVIKDS